jgi:hypothetical protein
MSGRCTLAWRIGVVIALAGAACLVAGEMPAAEALSQAERRLFVDHHLQGLPIPVTLRYALVRTGTLEPQRHDEMRLVLQPGRDGRVTATGGLAAEAQALPPIDDAKANPAVLYFLEHDVRDMQRLTGGQANHFRRRIRGALADAATLEETTVRHRGRILPAVELRIAPYVDDPVRGRYERFAAKQYSFVLADGVPGRVVQMRMRVPGPSAGGPPLLQETLTLEDASTTTPTDR